MRPLIEITKKLHFRICGASIKYFVVLRACLGLVLAAVLVEHVVNAASIRNTSITFLSTLQNRDSLSSLFMNYIFSNPQIHLLFLFSCLLLTFLYLLGIGGLWMVWLLLAGEWIFQLIHLGNFYGHEGALHQFLLLMVLIESGQGRIKTRLGRLAWKPSLVSGLAVILIRLQLVTVYFMSGLAKFRSPDWQSPDILQRIFLNQNYNVTFFDFIFVSPAAAPLLIIGTKLLLLLFPLVLIKGWMQKLILAAGALFHLVLALKMSLFVFGFFMVSLYLVLFNEESESSVQKPPLSPSI